MPQAPIDNAPPPLPSAAELKRRLGRCMLADQGRLRRRLKGLDRARRAGKDTAKALLSLARDIDASVARRQWRLEHLPRPEFPPELPVSEHREAIAAAIRKHQVVIVAGETGSGKTTQLPKICLELGRGVAGAIGCTQPRRIAAVSVAGRVAKEVGSELGEAVGYKIRFGDRSSPRGFIKFMTDGILLAETRGDRRLTAYDTLIIDEAHERSLNIDFLLGYLRQLLPRRPDLKVIISSATLDTERFSEFFHGAPVVQVSGRTYPVEVRYQPPAADTDLAEAVADTVQGLNAKDHSGDVLVFLSGERDIREATEALHKRRLPGAEVLPLYARLSQAEQSRVFRPSGKQKVILATNVAETSLTIPGIRYVVDTGLARIHRYSYRTQVSRLQIEPVSQASCNQRKGRCGRIGPGVCVRLYAQEDFEQRPEYTDPEIKRTSLAEVILRMKSLHLLQDNGDRTRPSKAQRQEKSTTAEAQADLSSYNSKSKIQNSKLRDVEDFPFIEPPTPRMIKDGYRVLEELGAVDGKHRLTPLGERLARLPIDPRAGRMVLAGAQFGALDELLVLAAFLGIQDPRERPMDKRQAADEKHKAFHDPKSDFMAVLNLWRFYLETLEERPTRSRLRKLCREHFLSYTRMLEWRDVHQQLQGMAAEMKLRSNSRPADYDTIHRALLTGLLSRIGMLTEDKTYLGARQMRFALFPGSGLFKRPPKWVACAELVDTARLYGRMAARIDPDWIEPLAGDLVHRTWSEPHWEQRRGQVVAYEQVTLYGLPVVTRRKVNYGPLDPAAARDLFIRGALVAGELRTRASFLEHNQRLVEEVEGLEHKSRRRDVLVDDEVLVQFYHQRLPAEVYDAKTFEDWRRRTEKAQPRLLYMGKADLMAHQAESITGERFPDHLHVGDLDLSLAYQFEPGSEDDGVSATLPLSTLNQIQGERLDWLVPGLLGERLTWLIKALPKSLRRNFVPVPEFVQAALESLRPEDGPLLPALSRFLLRLTGVEVPLDAWRPQDLPDHLRMNLRVVDEQGKVVAQGRDLEALRERLRSKAKEGFRKLPKRQWERDGITQWDFGEIPERVEIDQTGLRHYGYPALTDQGESVALRLYDTAEEAEEQHRAGSRRLFALQLRSLLRGLEKSLPIPRNLLLAYSKLGARSAAGANLGAEVVDAALDRVFLLDQPPVRDPETFSQRLQQGRSKLHAVATELVQRLEPVLVTRQAIAARILDRPRSPAEQEAYADIAGQLEYLFPERFIIRLPDARLRHYPRYLKAIELRLERLALAPGKDQQRLRELAPFWQAFVQHYAPGEPLEDALAEEYRWMLEEFRVSLFAQELGTAKPVSAKRLNKMGFSPKGKAP